jgi:succinyl-CoA synthetase alpha subunit
MAILVDGNTHVLVQGITGRQGAFHTRAMLRYGTRVEAGVTPGKGGRSVEGVPVYDSVEEALANHPSINTSLIMVPAAYAADAVYEALGNGIKLVVIITEHVPVHDTLKFVRYASLQGARVIGPNCPGVITPGAAKVGIMPGHIFKQGGVGIGSRSGTLTYEIAYAVTLKGLGQSTCVGIGGDPVVGMDFIEVLEMFRKDPGTDAVVLIGEIGGDMEERAAAYIRETNYPKPVVAYIAGRTAPPEKRMGHAGAIISMGAGDAESKVKALTAAGVYVASTPSEVAEKLSKLQGHSKITR